MLQSLKYSMNVVLTTSQLMGSPKNCLLVEIILSNNSSEVVNCTPVETALELDFFTSECVFFVLEFDFLPYLTFSGIFLR
jgi:hypothetical protein